MAAIDLRSDTVTLPTEAMRRAMEAATLGDDSLEGDATVQRLEQTAAALLGKPQAVFLVSGTMGNLVGAVVHGSGGQRAIVDEHAHILRSEGGGITRLAGLVCEALPERGGEMDLDLVRAKLRAGGKQADCHNAIVVVESSHNFSGGAVPSLPYMRSLQAVARETGVPVHLDGARLFNAAHALDVPPHEIAACADSVTVCLSKGLSAPMGSVLAGPEDFVSRARVARRMLGGGLRQAGIMAAAGLVALQEMSMRLPEDHANACLLWDALARDSGLVSAQPPQTNILMLNVTRQCEQRPIQAWVDELARQGVLVRARDACTLRAVTHRHISADDAKAAAKILRRVLG